jgi:hypothetical protein
MRLNTIDAFIYKRLSYFRLGGFAFLFLFFLLSVIFSPLALSFFVLVVGFSILTVKSPQPNTRSNTVGRIIFTSFLAPVCVVSFVLVTEHFISNFIPQLELNESVLNGLPNLAVVFLYALALFTVYRFFLFFRRFLRGAWQISKAGAIVAKQDLVNVAHDFESSRARLRLLLLLNKQLPAKMTAKPAPKIL